LLGLTTLVDAAVAGTTLVDAAVAETTLVDAVVAGNILGTTKRKRTVHDDSMEGLYEWMKKLKKTSAARTTKSGA
jgi:hypothetical protein